MGNSSSKARKQLLHGKIMEVMGLKDQVINCVRDCDTLETCLKEFSSRNILSAPVYSEEHKTILGFIDLLDILWYILRKHDEKGDAFLHNPRELSIVAAGDICGSSQQDPFVLMEANATLQDVILKFISHKSHRIALAHPNKKDVCAILTQSNIVSFLAFHLKDIYEMPEKPFKDFTSLGTEHVMCVDEKDRTIDAFLNMRQKGFSILGVLNSHGVLTACLSISHMKAIQSHNLADLLLPVRVFTSKRMQEACSNNDFRPQVLSGDESSTFASIINSLHRNRYHHFFVVDRFSGVPVSLISLHDVLVEITESGRLHLE